MLVLGKFVISEASSLPGYYQQRESTMTNCVVESCSVGGAGRGGVVVTVFDGASGMMP